MVIDTSAFYAIIAREPERSTLLRAIVSDPVRLLSAFTLLKTLIVIQPRLKDDGINRFQRLIAQGIGGHRTF